MKKFLSMALALVMTLSLVTASAEAKEFTDSEDISYVEAVDVISAIGVVDGYSDGSFNPTAGLTRGAAAKIICNMILGPTAAGALSADTAPFSDVAVDSTYAGYIAYCQSQGIIGGYSDGTFRPYNDLSGYAFMKMLLGALGYKSDVEGYSGANWSINVAKRALGIGLQEGLLTEFSGTKSLTREEACLYAFNTLNTTMVNYDNTIFVGNVVIAGSTANETANTSTVETVKNDNKMQFAEKYFPKLTRKADTTDSFGRPSETWIFNKVEVGNYVDYTTLAASYTTEVEGGDVYNDVGSAAAKYSDVTYFIDGVEQDDATTQKLMADVKKGDGDAFGVSGNGVLMELYIDTDAESIVVVAINTYIARVTADYNSNKEYVSVDIANYDGSLSRIYKKNVSEAENLVEDDMILVNIANGVVMEVMEPETLSNSEITKFSTGEYIITDDTKYLFAETLEDYSGNFDKYYVSDALADKTYDLYLDQYGNVIGIELSSGTDRYLFLTGYDKPNSNLAVKKADAMVVFLDGTMEQVQIHFSDTNENIDDYNEDNGTDFDTLSASGDANVNQWFKYREDDGVYTLTPVERTVVVAYGEDAPAKTKINSQNVRLSDGDGNVAYGNDNSVFITTEVSDVDVDENASPYDCLSGISDVLGVYTGVQDVELELMDNSDVFDGDVIYALYDEDLYIIGAIVLGEQKDADNTGFAYALEGVSSESYVGGYYFWEFEAVVNGQVETLTVKTKYEDVIDTILDAIVEYDDSEEAWVTPNGLLELSYDDNGYVVDAVVVNEENGYDNLYTNTQWEATADIDPDLYDAYMVDYTAVDGGVNLIYQGRTLYTDTTLDPGLTLISGAPVVVVQVVEDEDGDESRSIVEYTSVSAALNSLQNEGTGFQGVIAAELDTKGRAEWIVISSAVILEHEETESGTPSTDLKNVTITVDENTAGISVEYTNEATTVYTTAKLLDAIEGKLEAAGWTVAEKTIDESGNYVFSCTKTISGFTKSLSFTWDGTAANEPAAE